MELVVKRGEAVGFCCCVPAYLPGTEMTRGMMYYLTKSVSRLWSCRLQLRSLLVRQIQFSHLTFYNQYRAGTSNVIVPVILRMWEACCSWKGKTRGFHFSKSKSACLSKSENYGGVFVFTIMVKEEVAFQQCLNECNQHSSYMCQNLSSKTHKVSFL